MAVDDDELLVSFVKQHAKYQGQRHIELLFMHQRACSDADRTTRVFAASYDLVERTISVSATAAKRLVFTLYGARPVSCTTSTVMVFDCERERDAYTTSTAVRCFSTLDEWCAAIYSAVPGNRLRNVLAAVYWPEISKQISIADMIKQRPQPAPAAVVAAAATAAAKPLVLPPRPPPPLARECVAYDTVTAMLAILSDAKRKRFSSRDNDDDNITDAKRIARAHQKAAELVSLYSDISDTAPARVSVTSVPPKTFVRDIDTIISTNDLWL